MPEMNDNDLRKLFQAVGHAQPERDLSDRIMARVAVTRIAEPTVVPPLIGKWGWAGIAGAAVFIIAAAFMTSGTSATSTLPYADTIMSWFSQKRLPEGQWPQWVIGSSVLALFFALLMRKVERRATA
ncbi:MAG: hypothetical protein IPJ85_04130 [Flavobacteriales bacterium]|nr:hypothetical protein [Flavobacteriales bacterium]